MTVQAHKNTTWDLNSERIISDLRINHDHSVQNPSLSFIFVHYSKKI